jgi:hypothetical protein
VQQRKAAVLHASCCYSPEEPAFIVTASNELLKAPLMGAGSNRSRLLPEQTFSPDAYRLPEGTQHGDVAQFSPRAEPVTVWDIPLESD